MVVPVDLQVEVSDNNDHDGIFPGSLGSVLQHLERNQALKPASSATEKMASRSQQQLPFSKNHPADHRFLRSLSPWSSPSSLLDKSKELQHPQQELQLVSSSLALNSIGWSPKSCFLQFAPQRQQSSSLSLFDSSHQAFFFPHKSTDSSHGRRGGQQKKARSTVAGDAPAAELPRATARDCALSSSCRRDDSSSIHRSGGKMTSLGASPKCNVCSHKPNEARVITFCGHLFCWPCLCCWLHNKSPDKECPVCNRPLTKNHITPLHGRQNSLTVARLQGMLRPEKTSSSSRVHSRGEGAWSRRHQSRTTATAAAAAAVPPVTSKSAPPGVRGIVFDAAPKINPSKVENDSSSSIMSILARESSSSFFCPARTPAAPPLPPVEPAAAAAAAAENSAATAAAVTAAADQVTHDQQARPAAKSSFELAPALSSDAMALSPQQEQQNSQLGSATSLYAAISTASTVVTTDVCDADPQTMIDFPSPPPAFEFSTEVAAGFEEIQELGVLLSLEWEGAMSAIENAWWDAVSDVLNTSSNNADEMGIVERLSREKETIIHELASEPLKGSNWLASRLDGFKTIASEEVDNRTSVSQEFTPMEIEDWFLDPPDDGQILFPEFGDQDSAEEAEEVKRPS